MPEVRVEVTTNTDTLIDGLIDIVGMEDDGGDCLTLLDFIAKCRVNHSVTIEGDAPDWALEEALPDEIIIRAYRERAAGSGEEVNTRDFRDGLTAALEGDYHTARALFDRAIEDDTLRGQIEMILRNHMKVAA